MNYAKPLSSVIALSCLLGANILDTESREIVERLKHASEELDTIVRAYNMQLTNAKNKNNVTGPRA